MKSISRSCAPKAPVVKMSTKRPPRLLQRNDKRITNDGVIVIKAQQYRSLERNKEEALRRLHQLIQSAATIAKPRTPTKPTKSGREKRLLAKRQRSAIKTSRKRVTED
jgi:ribosome-associated protein